MLIGCNVCGCKSKGSFMRQAVPLASAKAARLAGEAAVRAARLAAVEDTLWGAPGAAAAWRFLGRARRAKPYPTLAQRLARRAAAALAAKFAVELEDVRVLLLVGQPRDADRMRTGGGLQSLNTEPNPGPGSKGKPGGSTASSRSGGAEPHPSVALQLRSLTLHGVLGPPALHPSSGRPCAFAASLRLLGMCLDVTAPGTRNPGGSAGVKGPQCMKTSIVRQWSVAATLRWQAAGVPAGEPTERMHTVAAGRGASHPRKTPGPAAGEAVLEVTANALRVAGDGGAFTAALTALAGLTSFYRFRQYRCTRPQARPVTRLYCLVNDSASTLHAPSGVNG